VLFIWKYNARGVGGRQGGGREKMSAMVKQKKQKNRLEECHLGQEQRRVTLPQRYVTMYGTSCTSISVTHSKWYIRKAPFVLGAQPLDENPLSGCWPA
jgi:hypothetical protein